LRQTSRGRSARRLLLTGKGRATGGFGSDTSTVAEVYACNHS
jgi:hypothetical protein